VAEVLIRTVGQRLPVEPVLYKQESGPELHGGLIVVGASFEGVQPGHRGTAWT
jgi:hypothetical protein